MEIITREVLVKGSVIQNNYYFTERVGEKNKSTKAPTTKVTNSPSVRVLLNFML